MAIIMISKVNSDKLEPERPSFCRTDDDSSALVAKLAATTMMMMIMMASLGLIFSGSGEIGSLIFFLPFFLNGK